MANSKDFMRIKQIVNNNKFPFDYVPNKWKNVICDTNCYAYALNSLYPEKSSSNTLYYVGAFSGYKFNQYCTSEELLERLFADFDFLGLKIGESTFDAVIPKDSYKICFLSSEDDFHFFRYDKQGFWSHKSGWSSLPTNKYCGQIITNPNIARKNYDIIGYYIISR